MRYFRHRSKTWREDMQDCLLTVYVGNVLSEHPTKAVELPEPEMTHEWRQLTALTKDEEALKRVRHSNHSL